MPISSLRTETKLAYAMLFLSAVAAVFTVVLVVRCYMPCPFWDQWSVISQIAAGSRPTSLSWLWSQHNEHRIAIPRLLIYLDVFAFGAKNVSLQVESFVLQFLGWAAICYFVERYSELPRSLKRSTEGIYAFCLFHPKQENFFEPFQISFILPFALGTIAFLLVAFFHEFRRPILSTAVAAVVPFVAALNLAGGLLIGPVLTALAVARGVPKRFSIFISATWLAAAAAYFTNYHHSEGTVLHARDFVNYLLIYFGERWFRTGRYEDGPVVATSLLCFALLTILAFRRRREVTALECFLIAECALAILSASLTALARLQFGVEQAHAARYQTVALLCWSSFFSLVLLRVWRWRPNYLKFAQLALVAILLLSICSFPGVWRTHMAEAGPRQLACAAVMNGPYTKEQASKLFPVPEQLDPAVHFLRERWGLEDR